ncbi:vacuolar membrane-associated protein iml1 [Serendipita sp. 411]|nr:vacuolar membrane-associated protein iml1 [Serendipita sp. 411]
MATARRRSGTLLSQFNAQTSHQSISIGGSIILQTSTHPNSANNYPNVLLNRDRWPGIQVGDVIKLETPTMGEPCIFVIDESDPVGLPYNVQVSLSSDIAECFDIRGGTEVALTKVDPSTFAAEALEIFFRDQYLGRPDMWRLSSSLVGKCWHAEQKLEFVGSISTTIKNIYRNAKLVKGAFVSPETKIVYRSLTARCTIFIQLCRELWDFADDGERYYEKVVHSFLPALFKEWKKLGARHVITIVLISRVFYDASEVGYAAGPIRQDDDGRNYKDFYKVVTDIEILEDWKPTLNSMKEALIAFQRDILLTHHYHQHQGGNEQVPKLVGNISYAHDGPILEALNLGLAPTEAHYIDRSLSLTGSSTILITPGKGHFRVSKRLLKLTTTRVLDQGFGLDVVALGKAPLHATPLFSFVATDSSQSTKEENVAQATDRSDDILWGNVEDNAPADYVDGRKIFYWQPFWIFLTFWDIRMDLPFREDRYIPRARMPQFESMGLLHYDLISSIAIPALDTSTSDLASSEAQDHFDQDVFSSVPTAATSPVSTSDNPFVSWNSISKISTAISSLNVPPGKQNMLRRTPSATSINNIGRPSKLSRTDSVEDEQVSRRSRPPSVQFDDMTRERLAAIVSGTSPKSSRLAQVQAERRARNTSQNLSMTDASSSNLTRRVSASTRNKSPNQSRRNSTAQPPTRQRRESNADGKAEVTEKESLEVTTPRKAVDNNEKRLGGLQLPFGRFTGSWLLTPWRLNSQPPKEAPSPLSKAITQTDIPSKKVPDPPPKPSVTQPLAINDHSKRSNRGKATEDQNLAPGQRLSATRDSPMSSSPAETPALGTSFRNSTGSGLGHQQLINPSATEVPVLKTQTALARRWEHIYTLPSLETDIKWKARELGGFKNRSLPRGPSEILSNIEVPIYLSMTDQIHRLQYDPTGPSIRVERYVRRAATVLPTIPYQCLIWPKRGGGYTTCATNFKAPDIERYGWNRIDMLVFGYEQQFAENMRYWRTRFIVIPTEEKPQQRGGPKGGKPLSDEELRLLGMERLADHFTKARWLKAGETLESYPPVKFLPTTLDPVSSLSDDALMSKLAEIHESGPLKKKPNNSRTIEATAGDLMALASLMRHPEDGLSIRDNKWHNATYHDSFTGEEFVSWLLREFQDVSTREQGAEWGSKLEQMKFLRHGRHYHGFIDGHYYYRILPPYHVAIATRPTLPYKLTNRILRNADDRSLSGRSQSPKQARNSNSPRDQVSSPVRRILSQDMVIDVDPQKKSGQAETAILHYDIIQNPGTAFHFQLHWVATSAKFIDEMIKTWGRSIEWFGLRLVEAYVEQVTDINQTNVFQSCFPIRFSVPPPAIPPDASVLPDYFEGCLLRHFGYLGAFWDETLRDLTKGGETSTSAFRPSA